MEEKLKFKPTITAIIVVSVCIGLLIINLVVGVLMYFEGDENFVYEYDYASEVEVRNSPVYQFALDVFSEIEVNDDIDELRQVKWMKHYREDFVSYAYSAYFHIVYVSNGTVKEVYYLNQDATIRSQYWGSYSEVDFIEEITGEQYRNEMDSWLMVDDYETSVLAREKSYNRYALDVFMSKIGG